MFMEERQQAILNIIKNEGRISIGTIQERFNVSVDTARRDLRILEEKKLLKRTRGGAISLPQIGQSSPVRMQYYSNMILQMLIQIMTPLPLRPSVYHAK